MRSDCVDIVLGIHTLLKSTSRRLHLFRRDMSWRGYGSWIHSDVEYTTKPPELRFALIVNSITSESKRVQLLERIHTDTCR
jgi:hypothetical protein